jgi:predicted neuraminidase
VGCVPDSNSFLDPNLEFAFNVETSPGIPSAGDAVFQTQLVFDSIDGRIGSHAPTITAMPDGELLAAWYSYKGPGELDDSAIYVARRPAGQNAWSAPQIHLDRSEPEGNPVLYSEGEAVWMFSAVAPFG